MDTTTHPNQQVAISVPPPLNNSVEYFSEKTVPIQITNRWPGPIVLEDVTLRFSADSAAGGVYIVDKSCAQRVPADGLIDLQVRLTPTALFQEYTNLFDVLIHYRREIDGHVENERLSERHDRASFLIVNAPKDTIGLVFISFKQPEDFKLARILEPYARRAGFVPQMIALDSQPGTVQWDRIEEQIQRSCGMFIIWDNHTEWGDGVMKEIELCRKHGVREILLLATRVPKPALFSGEIEYLRFDADTPHADFADAVAKTRFAVLSSGQPNR